MGGLSRFASGRFVNYTQLNSGLPNDVVYGVAVQSGSVWVATAAGGARLDTRTGQWSLFNERNTPMYEIWTYAVNATPSKVYFAVWGGGVLEYDVRNEAWKDYNDPDGETEIVLLKDQGLIHEITTSVSYVEKEQMRWVATYFGASRYDGRTWHNYLQKDSGLPSNFLNQVKAIDATRAWFSTDKGLAYVDGDTWAVYRPALDTQKPEMYVRDPSGKITNIETATAPAHNYVLGVDFQGDDIWVATAKGLSHGIRIPPEPSNPSPRAPNRRKPNSAALPCYTGSDLFVGRAPWPAPDPLVRLPLSPPSVTICSIRPQPVAEFAAASPIHLSPNSASFTNTSNGAAHEASGTPQEPRTLSSRAHRAPNSPVPTAIRIHQGDAPHDR